MKKAITLTMLATASLLATTAMAQDKAPAAAPTLIPLNQLHRSDLNVRKTGGTDVTELAANIRAAQRLFAVF